jgi:hypothetical protein
VVLARLSQHLKDGFRDHKFPKEMENIAIGIICVEPKFEPFFKPRPPKLTKDKVYKEEGFEQPLGSVFEYEINLDYQKAKAMDEAQFTEYVKEALIGSFEILDQHLYNGSGELKNDFYSVVQSS